MSAVSRPAFDVTAFVPSRPASRLRLDDDEHGARLHQCTFDRPDLADAAGARRAHVVLHLHRFEHRHRLAVRDDIANGDQHLDDPPGIGATAACCPGPLLQRPPDDVARRWLPGNETGTGTPST